MKICEETVFTTAKEKTDYMGGVVTGKCEKCDHQIKITFSLVESMYEEMIKGKIKKKIVEGIFWDI